MKHLFFILSIVFSCYGISQENWSDLREQGASFSEIQEAFELEWDNKEYTRGSGYNLYKRWEYFMGPRCYPSGDIRISPKYIEAYEKTVSKKRSIRKSAGDWGPLGPTEWNTQSYNPGNGRVNLIVKDPSASNTYYVGTPAGGLWRTTNEFGTWEPLTDNLPTLGVSGIVIHPDNSDIIYIGTGDGDGTDTYSNGVLKTNDGGLTWNTTGFSYSLSEELQVHKLLMHPENPDILFAATRVGLWKTTTAGEVWYEVRIGNIRDVEFHPENPDIVYCCSTRFYKSTDGGENFSTSGSGLPGSSSVGRISLGVSVDEPNYVYALCVDDDTNGLFGLYRSTDSADTFVERSNASTNILGYSVNGDSEGGQGWYDLGLAVNPANAENIFTGGVNVWRSINGGNGFIVNSDWFYVDDMTYNYVHADIHNIQYIGSDLFVCSDGGVFRSTNNGVSFEDISKGLQISQFYRIGGYTPDPSLLIGGTQDNGSNLLSGTTWTHVLGADGMEAAIHPLNPDVMYCASQEGGLNGSLNGGDSFQYIAGSIYDEGNWVTPYVLHPTETGTIYAGFTDIWKSEDNGGTFTQVSELNSGGIVDMTICKSNPEVLYACSSSRVYKSLSSGNNWEEIAFNISQYSITYIDVNPSDANDVVVTYSGFGDGDKVYRSKDGGESWENVSLNLPNVPANCVAVNGEDGSLYVGTDLGVYYWTPLLVNWMPFNEGLPNVIVNEIEINNEFDQITAATFGRGIWRSSQFGGVTEEPTALFESDKRIICEGDSIQFTDISFGHEAVWQWDFEGANLETSEEQNPLIQYDVPGVYRVTLTVQNDEGEDISTEESYIIVQSSDEEFPYSEPFGDLSLIDYEFVTEPLSGDVNWKINDDIGYSDPGCVWIENGNLDEPFQTELFSKQFDLSDQGTVFLSFRYAYAQKHPENDDRMVLFVSNNCGQTWDQRETFRGPDELNSNGAALLEEFEPDQNNKWRFYIEELETGDLVENFSFKLRFMNDNGNHIYVDDINLSSVNLSVASSSAEVVGLSIYPNPARDEIIIASDVRNEGLSLILTNAVGQNIYGKVLALPSGNSFSKLDVSGLTFGVYYLQVINDQNQTVTTKKLLIH